MKLERTWKPNRFRAICISANINFLSNMWTKNTHAPFAQKPDTRKENAIRKAILKLSKYEIYVKYKQNNQMTKQDMNLQPGKLFNTQVNTSKTMRKPANQNKARQKSQVN